MIDECIFKTSFANILIQSKNASIIRLIFTTKRVKFSKNPVLMNAKNEILEYIAGERKVFTFKIDPEGTYFQKKVWKQLKMIPYGKSVYYSLIADKVESSPRAVGNACGANKCLLIIPCHRVISKNTGHISFSSFGGMIHKARLLSHEKMRLISNK